MYIFSFVVHATGVPADLHLFWWGGSGWRRGGAGAIPPEFGKLRKLQRFNAGHNIGLSGACVFKVCIDIDRAAL